MSGMRLAALRFPGWILHPILLVTLILATACGGGGAGEGTSGGGNTLSQLTVTPTNPSVLLTTDSIVIIFPGNMNTTSLVLGGGDLDTEDNGGSWGETYTPDDTLTVSPASTWTPGGERTLTVDVNDEQGVAQNTLTLSFNVIQGIIYVRTTGDDANDGSIGNPKKTISAAITAADAAYTQGAVYVAAGSYDESAVFTLAEGISLYGGFAATDWATRDPATHTTSLTYAANALTGTTLDPAHTVYADSTITNNTALEGLTITGAGPSNTTAVLISVGCPVLRDNVLIGGSGTNYNHAIKANSPAAACDLLIENNTIDGGSGGSRTHGIALNATNTNSTVPVVRGNTIVTGTGSSGYGLYLVNSSPTINNNNITANGINSLYGISGATGSNGTISNNTINMDETGSPSLTRGIDLTSTSSPTISGNTIDGGNGSSTARGIQFVGSSPTIANNTIYGGDNTNNTYGISGATSGTPSITGNTVHGGSGTTAQGVRLTSVIPTALSGNTITGGNGCSTCEGIYLSGTGSPTIEGNTVTAGTGTGAGNTYAIHLTTGATPKILGNALVGGSGGSTRGIYAQSNSNATILNNLIFGGLGNVGNAYGIQSSGSALVIVGNTINGGDGTGNSYGIYMAGSNTNSVIVNNLIFTEDSAIYDFCVREDTDSGDPVEFNNNDLFDCSDGLYYDGETGGAGALATIGDVETDLAAETTPSVIITPDSNLSNSAAGFADRAGKDYSLTVGTAGAITGGGKDVSGTYPDTATDYTGATRTAPWSIGAIEFD